MLDTNRNALIVTIALVISAFALTAPFAGAASSAGPRPAKAVTITLYGSLSSPAGWGWTPNNITEPGPVLTVAQGDVITFHLFSNDSMAHILVIDLNNNQVQDTPDQASTQFSSPTTATDFTFTASTAGTFNYFCGVHGYAAQHGSLVVQSAGGGPAADNTVLIIGGVVIVIAIVAVAAAVMMRRKKPGPGP